MAQESLLDRVKSALHIICHAFARFADLGSEEEELRIADAVRSSTPQERQSLRWSLPFLWITLVYLSFVFAYSTLRPCVPALVHTDFSLAAQNVPLLMPLLMTLLIGAQNDDEHSPEHGEDPHGKDPHDEIHDPGLPANQDQPDIPEKDPKGKPKY